MLTPIMNVAKYRWKTWTYKVLSKEARTLAKQSTVFDITPCGLPRVVIGDMQNRFCEMVFIDASWCIPPTLSECLNVAFTGNKNPRDRSSGYVHR